MFLKKVCLKSFLCFKSQQSLPATTNLISNISNKLECGVFLFENSEEVDDVMMNNGKCGKNFENGLIISFLDPNKFM